MNAKLDLGIRNFDIEPQHPVNEHGYQVSKTGADSRQESPRGGSNETLTERAYARLEEMIVTLELAPGTVLSENGLSLALGIGRTPIREALQCLSREGLVRVHPRKAIIVTETDPSKQLLVLEVRRELERLLAKLSAERASPSERAQFEAIATGMLQAARADDDITFLRLDRVLNDLLADAAHNEFALRSMRVLNGHSRRFWYLHYKHAADLPKVARLHADQARAIASGNAERAAVASDRLLDYVAHFTRGTINGPGRKSMRDPSRSMKMSR